MKSDMIFFSLMAYLKMPHDIRNRYSPSVGQQVIVSVDKSMIYIDICSILVPEKKNRTFKNIHIGL